ncbi:sperm flagellar protein 1-like [Rhopalosiphum maidis]|uniref:sperm flagellar protein 1-like n=1 Tax=Rhopalosiphum maidis TaxID=43146 RepID=UPI000F0051B9|nr:sperm flagellar protein 1-like [Rhopalosiphum maidis]
MTSGNDYSKCENQSCSFPSSSQGDSLNNDNPINLSNIIHWINSFEFIRPKKTIVRDFSDATMVAEIIKYYWPKLIDLHNYVPASSFTNKISNWDTLNRKVLKKVKLPLSKETIEKLSMADPNTIFQFLKSLKVVIDELEHEKQLRLEKNQNCPLYIIVKDEMIQVTENDCCTKEYLSKEVVALINKLQHKINDMEHKIDHISSLICVKDRRIKDLQSQLNQLKKDNTS